MGCDQLQTHIEPRFPFVTDLKASIAISPHIVAMDGVSIGIIGMGDMGRLYTQRFSQAGWR